LIESLEKALIRREAPDYRQNLRIFEALYREARSLRVIPLEYPLDGIEVDVHLAGVLNARRTARADCESA
jgi:hypothetical protein